MTENMTENMTDRELLRLHIEAVWDLDLPTSFDEMEPALVLPETSQPPWSLYLATLASARVAIWQSRVQPAERSPLLERAQQAGVMWESELRMRCEMVFSAPTLTPEQQRQAQQARILGPADAALVDTFEAESASYFLDPSHAPCIGVEVDGRLVTVAHSSRRTPSACELGINTLPEARRRGYAKVATTLWTATVQQQGLVPIYSAFAWNTASLQLAQVVGFQPRIDGAYGPVPAGEE